MMLIEVTIDRRTHACRLAIACAAAVLVGCCRGLGSDAAKTDIRPSRVNTIEALDLEARSKSRPVTVEEASKGVFERAAGADSTAAAARMSIQEVRAAALAGNLDAKVQLISPSIAQEDVLAEEAKFDPLLSATARHDRLEYRREDDAALTSVGAGVKIPLRTGGTLSTTLPAQVLKAQGEDATWSTALGFSISHPLLRDAGTRVNRGSIEIAGLGKRITDARTKLSIIGILAEADREYWNLYGARRELEVGRQQYNLATEQLSLARKMVQAGASPSIEITRAESGLSQRMENIIIAETTVRSRERNLKRIMNRSDLPMNSSVPIEPTTQPTPIGLDLDADALANMAMGERMDLLELELQIAADAISVELRRNAALPSVDLLFDYTISGAAGDISDAFDRMAERPDTSFSVGVTADVPVGNKAAKARLREVIKRRLQRMSMQKALQLAVQQEVYDAVGQLEQNWQRILTTRQGTVVAARNYQAEQSQFELGMRTSIEVLDAATRLAEAQLREIQALAGYEISKISLAVATGTLIGTDSVHLDVSMLDEGDPK